MLPLAASETTRCSMPQHAITGCSAVTDGSTLTQAAARGSAVAGVSALSHAAARGSAGVSALSHAAALGKAAARGSVTHHAKKYEIARFRNRKPPLAAAYRSTLPPSCSTLRLSKRGSLFWTKSLAFKIIHIMLIARSFRVKHLI